MFRCRHLYCYPHDARPGNIEWHMKDSTVGWNGPRAGVLSVGLLQSECPSCYLDDPFIAPNGVAAKLIAKDYHFVDICNICVNALQALRHSR